VTFRAGEPLKVDLTVDDPNDRARVRYVPTPPEIADEMVKLAPVSGCRLPSRPRTTLPGRRRVFGQGRANQLLQMCLAARESRLRYKSANQSGRRHSSFSRSFVSGSIELCWESSESGSDGEARVGQSCTPAHERFCRRWFSTCAKQASWQLPGRSSTKILPSSSLSSTVTEALTITGWYSPGAARSVQKTWLPSLEQSTAITIRAGLASWGNHDTVEQRS
jgi:hypothetical protein